MTANLATHSVKLGLHISLDRQLDRLYTTQTKWR